MPVKKPGGAKGLIRVKPKTKAAFNRLKKPLETDDSLMRRILEQIEVSAKALKLLELRESVFAKAVKVSELIENTELKKALAAFRKAQTEGNETGMDNAVERLEPLVKELEAEAQEIVKAKLLEEAKEEAEAEYEKQVEAITQKKFADKLKKRQEDEQLLDAKKLQLETVERKKEELTGDINLLEVKLKEDPEGSGEDK